MTKAIEKPTRKKMEKEKHAGNVYWEDDADSEETDTTPTPSSAEYGDKRLQNEGADYDEEDEDDTDTCSSFSLQECIDEFRARRIRRISTQSRDQPIVDESDDKDLVEQNRSNKEQEKKCKPCKNGFCYCFTSDSGDGGCSVKGSIPPLSANSQARAAHMRRGRRSDSHQPAKSSLASGKIKDHARRSAPPVVYKESSVPDTNKGSSDLWDNKATSRLPLTAISRLETSSADAPLIHIIQELHDNCVISEVRVNKQKVEAHQKNFHGSISPSKIIKDYNNYLKEDSSRKSLHEAINDIIKSSPKKAQKDSKDLYQPSAPGLDTISEQDSGNEMDFKNLSIESGSLETSAPKRRHKHGGKLLEKRLSYSGLEYKPPDMKKPPKKPPRLHHHYQEDKSEESSNGSMSTTPSVRKAEKIIDKFLEDRGIPLPSSPKKKQSLHQKEKPAKKIVSRKSYPITDKLTSRKPSKKPLRTYPSLSDLEHFMEAKNPKNYEKNIRKNPTKQKQELVKELTLGWSAPKIIDMLNCDTNGNCKEFKSQAVQAEPQQVIGWRIPPKISLDTVDGPEEMNLATNIEKKDTPIKSPQVTPQKRSSSFIWGEQFIEKLSNESKESNNFKLPRKSNLKKSSQAFLKSSKKKILRLVTPKKDNKPPSSFKARKTPLRSIAIQTSREDLHTPPGSYRSANNPHFNNGESLQPSLSSTPSSINNNSTLPEPNKDSFDFNRTVQSPPKKSLPSKNSQRKLNFPLGCGNGMCSAKPETSSGNYRTYQSYNVELEQDLTLSKMNYVLNNIRARLEASDDHAIRTFQEVERREQERTLSFDCPDNFHQKNHHNSRHYKSQQIIHHNDPIYSEIEEDSIHISASPQFDNKTEPKLQTSIVDTNALYAKVNKPPKTHKDTKIVSTSSPQTLNQIIAPPLALGKFLHDSLKNRHQDVTSSPDSFLLAEQTKDDYISSPRSQKLEQLAAKSSSETADMPHCQSLNNIRVMEHHSPPKKNRNLSKSDLSLHRSEIFLENLYRSELVLHGDATKNNLQKQSNDPLNESYQSIENRLPGSGCGSQVYALSQNASMSETVDESVSYELPPRETGYDDIDGYTNPSAAGSQIIFSTPQKNNQSTPKKTQTFTTKLKNTISLPLRKSLSRDENEHFRTPPPTPKRNNDQTQQTCSLNEISNFEENQTRGPSSVDAGTMAPYTRLKRALQNSFRKSNKFVRKRTKHLSQSLNLPSNSFAPNSTEKLDSTEYATYETKSSSLYLDQLFFMDEIPIENQLIQAVSICRQIPNLEISPEMVEAERLLLFSTLKSNKKRFVPNLDVRSEQSLKRFYIDEMILPIEADSCQDIFYNYFYIVTFECGGIIKSSQSVECQNGEAIFKDCGIEFECLGEDPDKNEDIRCEIFMLRLRKVSTLALEPSKTLKIQKAKIPSTGSSSSSTDIVSRFRPHASFSLKDTNFVPYEYVEKLSKEKLCLRTSNTFKIPISTNKKSTNLKKEIFLKARAEIRLPKLKHEGFLNVEDPSTQHNWNLRWCTLDGLFFKIWQDSQSEEPLLILDLRCSLQTLPLEMVSRELCARPRAFCLQNAIRKAGEDTGEIVAIFFSAETNENLNQWLLQINTALHFIGFWIAS